MTDPLIRQGMVRAVQANFYRVRLAPLHLATLNGGDSSGDPSPFLPLLLSGDEVLCTRRARLKKLGQQVMVGDQVVVQLVDLALAQGSIIEVLPRRTALPRPPVANVDQALVLFALAEPPLDPVQLSRFLVQVEASGLRPQVCLNKVDLVPHGVRIQWEERLNGWGYPPFMVSALTGEGLSGLHPLCQNQISVVTGLSGVGKSTLLNRLIQGLDLETQPVSGRLRHGQHTTRHVELFPLDGGGWLADTPGFNQADLANCASETLIQAFPEARERVGGCQFHDCLHQQEPGCRIRDPGWERYPYYLTFLEEVLARELQEHATQDADSTLKTKSQSQNRQAAIPRLPSQFRQPSRRAQHQQTRSWQGDVTHLLQSEAGDE